MRIAMLAADAVILVLRCLILLICIEAVMSWFAGGFGPGLRKVYDLIRTFTEPVVTPFRKLLWRFVPPMGLDFSPVVAVLVIEFLVRILRRLVFILFLTL